MHENNLEIKAPPLRKPSESHLQGELCLFISTRELAGAFYPIKILQRLLGEKRDFEDVSCWPIIALK